MKFLVLWRMELALLSREMARAVGDMADYGEDLERAGQVLARYHVVGAHGGAWIYQVDSHEEFERLLARSPVFNFARYEVYPLAEMLPAAAAHGGIRPAGGPVEAVPAPAAGEPGGPAAVAGG